MAVTAEAVKQLRERTGAGMMECKKALTETNGDLDAAAELMRKAGLAKADKKASRIAAEGVIVIERSADGRSAVIVEVNCETDFVGKNEEFQNLGKLIVETAFAKKPATVEALLAESAGSLTINDKIVELIGKIGEKIQVSEYVRMTGEAVVPYIHAGSKLGVLVSLKGVNGKDVTDAGKDVGMQIAAMNPVAVDEKSIDKLIIDKELEIAKALILAEGKPENMVEKIAQGKLQKFFKDNTLVHQIFVKDNSKTVAQYLDSVSKGLTVAEFKRVTIG